MAGDSIIEQFHTISSSSSSSLNSPTSLSHSTIQLTTDIDHLLASFGRFGVDLGLDRILKLLDDLGNPQHRVPIIHVAGTNGKGSVCAYLSSILAQAGYRVGRYTSPHFVDWCERICINEQPISSKDLHTVLLQVKQAIRPDAPSPTQFEVITAAAWLYFAQQQVDLAVIEVGLGGRLDATNVCDRPLVTVITSISREHWQRLGPTVADIAGEKAGILKPDCLAVIGTLPPSAEAVVRQTLAKRGCPALWMPPATPLDDGWATLTLPAESPVPLEPLTYPLPLAGDHQLTNSALAIATLLSLRTQGWDISDHAIQDGMKHTRWPGRIQWFPWQGTDLLIDGAHNPGAAAVLRRYIDQSDRVSKPVHWVMGMLSTKDHADIFAELLRAGDRLSLVPVPDHSSADPKELATLARTICPELTSCDTCPDVFDALDPMSSSSVDLTPSSNPDSTMVLCGSLYLIGYFFKHAHVHLR